MILTFKSCVCYILSNLFFKSKKEEIVKLGMLFIFTSKALFVLEKVRFQNLDNQISWHQQMPKHNIRNTFYWITSEVDTVC